MKCPDCKTIEMLLWKEMSDGSPLAFEDFYYQCPKCKIEISLDDFHKGAVSV